MAAVREASAKRIPADRLAVMHDATEQLRGSGILDRVIKPGAKAPDFTLNDQNGNPVTLSLLLARRSRPDERVPRLLVTLLPA